mgnify:CR=1 FL=1
MSTKITILEVDEKDKVYFISALNGSSTVSYIAFKDKWPDGIEANKEIECEIRDNKEPDRLQVIYPIAKNVGYQKREYAPKPGLSIDQMIRERSALIASNMAPTYGTEENKRIFWDIVKKIEKYIRIGESDR